MRTPIGGGRASLLALHLERIFSSEESLRIATRVHLAAILSADEVLHNLGMFAFVISHLFSAGVRHSSAIVELLHLIESLEELHTKLQGIISSPHLATKIIYDVSWWWSLYLNRRVAVSELEALEAPGANTPFILEPILL